MPDDTPYKAPQQDPLMSPPPRLMVWMLGVVLAAAVAGGLIGTAIGATLGTLVPGYYRSVFAEGHSANFDPLAVGIGQGLTQGTAFGGAFGLIIAAIYSWQSAQGSRQST